MMLSFHCVATLENTADVVGVIQFRAVDRVGSVFPQIEFGSGKHSDDWREKVDPKTGKHVGWNR